MWFGKAKQEGGKSLTPRNSAPRQTVRRRSQDDRRNEAADPCAAIARRGCRLTQGVLHWGSGYSFGARAVRPFDYSDTCQLVINTGITIVTFLMVFLIQSKQNRDAKAVHLKLGELIRGIKSARIAFVDLKRPHIFRRYSSAPRRGTQKRVLAGQPSSTVGLSLCSLPLNCSRLKYMLPRASFRGEWGYNATRPLEVRLVQLRRLPGIQQ